MSPPPCRLRDLPAVPERLLLPLKSKQTGLLEGMGRPFTAAIVIWN